ncbi:hypothetical protein K438DRAFT_1880057 [Mycena galopus ATCC 62051]|nr:hypothetical protein K438DRAFT_1880057 [Mycena galopus ATCC 62051]
MNVFLFWLHLSHAALHCNLPVRAVDCPQLSMLEFTRPLHGQFIIWERHFSFEMDFPLPTLPTSLGLLGSLHSYQCLRDGGHLRPGTSQQVDAHQPRLRFARTSGFPPIVKWTTSCHHFIYRCTFPLLYHRVNTHSPAA